MYYNKGQYGENLSLLIDDNYENIFKNSKELEVGISKAFNGNFVNRDKENRLKGLQHLLITNSMIMNREHLHLIFLRHQKFSET